MFRCEVIATMNSWFHTIEIRKKNPTKRQFQNFNFFENEATNINFNVSPT